MILIRILLDLKHYFSIENNHLNQLKLCLKSYFLTEIKVRLDFERLISIKNQIIVDFRRFQSIVILI